MNILCIIYLYRINALWLFREFSLDVVLVKKVCFDELISTGVQKVAVICA